MKSAVFTKEDHWKFFPEFVKLEIASGGPDPQIPLVAEMSKDCSEAEKIWRAGCYICVYNVPFAEILWQNISWERVLTMDVIDIHKWLSDNWKGIITRVERRSVRKPEWMAQFLLEYRNWALSVLPEARKLFYGRLIYENYLNIWDSCQNVKYLGRYVALKLLEFYKTHLGFPIKEPDIRPKGGWSPRTTLADLYPEYATPLLGGESAQELHIVNTTVAQLKNDLREKFNLTPTLFQLQVLLCEYRESYSSQKQYPGRSHDSELGYWNKAQAHWKHKSEMFAARKRIFPEFHLGELYGWNGARAELGKNLATHRYTWSDLLYDYSKTTDFANPWRR